MKPIIQVILFFIIGASSTGCYTTQNTTASAYTNEPQEDQEVSMDVFYNELSPYGRWINDPSYGRVWVANISGFSPYRTNGHWAYTNYGWTWVSDFNWGWAPFHYGRWMNNPSFGWAWVPGYEWAPAWVSWRSSNDYYGWAPLAPGMGNGFGNAIPATHWNFVPNRYITNPALGRYYINNAQNTTIINNTTVINTTNVYRNSRFEAGPERLQVERATGTRIQPLQVNNISRPGATVDRRGMNLYRPQVRRENNGSIQPNGGVSPSPASGTINLPPSQPQQITAPSNTNTIKANNNGFTPANNTPTPIPAPAIQETERPLRQAPAQPSNNRRVDVPTRPQRITPATPTIRLQQQRTPNNNQPSPARTREIRPSNVQPAPRQRVAPQINNTPRPAAPRPLRQIRSN